MRAEHFPSAGPCCILSIIQLQGLLGIDALYQPFLNDALNPMKVCVLLAPSPSVLGTEPREPHAGCMLHP